MKHTFNRFRGRGEVGANAEAYAKCKDYYEQMDDIKKRNLPTGTTVKTFCGIDALEKMYMNSSRGHESPFIANKFRNARIKVENEEKEDNKQNKRPKTDAETYDDSRYALDKQSGGSKRKKSRKKSKRRARTRRR